MSCSCRKYAAWLSRSAKIATRTLAPVTSSRPDDCTWIAARWTTRWKPAVALASSPFSTTRFSSSVSIYRATFLRRTSTSTLQALSTAAPSGSSIKASSKCSKVAYSCRRSFAIASALRSVFSSARENTGISNLSLFFHDALQRMLVLARVVHDLRDLGLGDFVRENPALADAVVMHVQHDLGRFLGILVEERSQDRNHELHGRVVVVQQQNAVHVGSLRLCARASDDCRAVAGRVPGSTRFAGGSRHDRWRMGGHRGARDEEETRQQRHPCPKSAEERMRLAVHFRPLQLWYGSTRRDSRAATGPPLRGPRLI